MSARSTPTTDPDDRSDAAAVATAYLAALGGADPDAVADLVAADFVNEHQNALGSGCTGRDTYRRRLGGFFATFPSRTYDIERLVTGAVRSDGTTDVVARYRFRADVVVRDDDPHAPPRVEQIDIPGVMWIEVAGGEVVRRTDTWDAFTYFLQSGDTPPGFVRSGDTDR